MANFDYANFDKIFYEKIYPGLQPLEEQRKEIFLKAAIALISALLLTGILVIQFKVPCSTDWLYIPFIIAIIYIFVIIGNFRGKVKDSFYSYLFESIGFKYEQAICRKTFTSISSIKQFAKTYIQKQMEQDCYKENKKITEPFEASALVSQICETSNIFSRYDNIEIDDKISGEYKDLPFTALDTHIYYITRDSKGRSTTHTVFKGIVLTTQINKPLNCDILIKADRLFQSKTVGNKNVVRLEDPEFEKSFEVYATDQVEARYILTTAFMNRLLNYKKNKKVKSVEVVLSNNIFNNDITYSSEDNELEKAIFDELKNFNKNNVFFFIKTGKDNFEVPIFHTLLDKQVFLDILKELTDALDVINELKLEQNIGL